MKRLAADPRLVALGLFLATLLLFARATSFEFLNYDDDAYVTANPLVLEGLTWAKVTAAFTSRAAANWHPLTWLSHQLDVQLFGLDAGAHHRTSVLLHAASAALVFLALRALTGAHGRSALLALLFAVHPLRLESVAWVAERKDVLSGFLFAALLLAHARWLRRREAWAYAATLVLLALGLLAKPMLVSAPLVLLVLDLWLLERREHARAARALVPHLVLALAVAGVTLAVQEAGGARATLAGLSLGERCGLAVRALAQYLWASVWPVGLAPFHPHPALEPAPRLLALPLAAPLVGLLVLLVLAARRRAPALPVGALLFVGMLVPVLGFVPIGLAAWAERYTYLPSLGLGLALVFGGAELLPPAARRPAAVVLLALTGLAAWTSARGLGLWHDSQSLFAHAVAVEPSSVAHVQLALALESSGDLSGALRETDAALARRPELAGAELNRARLLDALGRPAEAVQALERAYALAPAAPEVRIELGWRLVQAPGDDTAGVVHLRGAHAARPDELEWTNQLAWVLATSPSAGAPEEALQLAQELVARAPRKLQYLETLAAAEARLGRYDEAARHQQELVLRLPERARAQPAERLELYRARRPYLAEP